MTLLASLEGVVAAVKDENTWVETGEGEEHPMPSVLDIDILATFISQLPFLKFFTHSYNAVILFI